jgi:hypothetical protein
MAANLIPCPHRVKWLQVQNRRAVGLLLEGHAASYRIPIEAPGKRQAEHMKM